MRYLFAGCSLFNHIMQYKCATQVKPHRFTNAWLKKLFWGVVFFTVKIMIQQP